MFYRQQLHKKDGFGDGGIRCIINGNNLPYYYAGERRKKHSRHLWQVGFMHIVLFSHGKKNNAMSVGNSLYQGKKIITSFNLTPHTHDYTAKKRKLSKHKIEPKEVIKR